jgi:hypothetical protein
MTFVRDVLIAATATLASKGFRRPKLGILECELAPGVVGWLGLNTATYETSDTVDVNPVVGGFGLPVLRTWSALPVLAAELPARGIPDFVRYTLPAARLLLGDAAGAHALVEAHVAALEGQVHPYAEHDRRFAAGFARAT